MPLNLMVNELQRSLAQDLSSVSVFPELEL